MIRRPKKGAISYNREMVMFSVEKGHIQNNMVESLSICQVPLLGSCLYFHMTGSYIQGLCTMGLFPLTLDTKSALNPLAAQHIHGTHSNIHHEAIPNIYVYQIGSTLNTWTLLSSQEPKRVFATLCVFMSYLVARLGSNSIQDRNKHTLTLRIPSHQDFIEDIRLIFLPRGGKDRKTA
jgi:hypothetical protein